MAMPQRKTNKQFNQWIAALLYQYCNVGGDDDADAQISDPEKVRLIMTSLPGCHMMMMIMIL